MLPRVSFVIPGDQRFHFVCIRCCSMVECFIIFATYSPESRLLDLVIQTIAAAWNPATP